MFSILLKYTSSKSDRRLDPFQFNLCTWNLDNVDNYDPNDKNWNNTIDDIATIMYSFLSTCDIFVLPGLRNDNTSNLINQKLVDKKFTDFDVYPKDAARDVTQLSRMDANDVNFLSNSVSYPIPDSQCSYTGQAGKIDFSKSWHATYTFHDPVPPTHIFNVEFNKPSSDPSLDCAIREAEAKSICDIISSFPEKDHVYVTGTFYNITDKPYLDIFSNCKLTDRSTIRKKYHVETREDHSVMETFFTNDQTKSYLDRVVFTDIAKNKYHLWDNEGFPVMLMTHQPLSKKWKTFEYSFAPTAVLIFLSFFIWLLYFSRVKKIDEYQAIE